ncbi:MAG: hypothetical protein GX131_16880 [candidate division WS1 bacterium]|jgi:hypothetical protein|nr:hypothetical protein [candidate division WS1 bacterium]
MSDISPMTFSHGGAQMRVCALVAVALVLLALPVQADRLLAFSVTSTVIGATPTAAITGDGTIIMRLRAANASGLEQKAEVIAARLTDLAIDGLKPEQVEVKQLQGLWSVTGAGKLIVTADEDTAAASGLTTRALCDSWRERIAAVLREPYLTVDPLHTLIVPHGEKRVVRYGGTLAGTPLIESMAPGVAAVEVTPGQKRLDVRGTSTGTTVVIFEIGTLRHGITIEVKRWAAQIAERALLEVMTGGLPDSMASVALLNASLSAVRAESHAVVRLGERRKTAAGWAVDVRAGGVDYLPVVRELAITARKGAQPIPDARTMLISNSPERVIGVGALMRQAIAAAVPARMMWHHKNYAGRPLVVSVRLVNAGPDQARIRIGWSQAGPDGDEIFVGYNAMMRYWSGPRAGQGFVAEVPPGAAFETATCLLRREDVVSGLMDILPECGSDLYIEVLARDPEDAPAGFIRLANHGNPLAQTPWEFPAYIEDDIEYEVGGRFGHLSIGREGIVNDQGITLDGSYGVNHIVRIRASNPTQQNARLEIAVRAGGGVARTVAAIDGALRSTKLLLAAQEEMLEQRDLAPGASTRVRLELIPTAGSNLPFTLVVRSRPL